MVAVGLARVRAGVKIRTPAYTLIYPPSWSPDDDDDGDDVCFDYGVDFSGGGVQGVHGGGGGGSVCGGGGVFFLVVQIWQLISTALHCLHPETSQTSCSI